MTDSDKIDAIYLNEPNLEYHRRQLTTPYRSTVHLIDFLQRRLGPLHGSALDVACGGAGALLHLSRAFPALSWSGLDFNDAALALARAACPPEVCLHRGDMYALGERFGRGSFDVVFFLQTLFTIEHGDALMAQLFAVARKWIVVSSLFSDSMVEARIQAMDRSSPVRQGPFHYNIESMPRFRERCIAAGALEVIDEEFRIDIDLPAPTGGGLGTFTRTLDSGERLQFSGPLAMPWRFVAIRLAASSSGEAAPR